MSVAGRFAVRQRDEYFLLGWRALTPAPPPIASRSSRSERSSWMRPSIFVVGPRATVACRQRSESEPPNVWKVSRLGRVRVYASLLSSLSLSQLPQPSAVSVGSAAILPRSVSRSCDEDSRGGLPQPCPIGGAVGGEDVDVVGGPHVVETALRVHTKLRSASTALPGAPSARKRP